MEEKEEKQQTDTPQGMTEENYRTLLDEIKKRDEKLSELEKKFDDVVKLNNTLLNTREDTKHIDTPQVEDFYDLVGYKKKGR